MNTNKSIWTIAVLGLCLGLAGQAAATVVTYSARSSFNAVAHPASVETFGGVDAYPIPSGLLNAATSGCCAVGVINAGDILTGVTYSTPVGVGDFFNIDTGGGYAGGFLDSLTSGAVLTVTFDSAQPAFGFDSNGLMGNFTVTMNSTGGQIFSQTVSEALGSLQFYGFVSTLSDIKSLTIAGDSAYLGFAIDNFTFGTSLPVSSAPEPDAWFLMVLGVGLVGGRMRRRGSRRGAPLRGTASGPALQV